MSKQEISPLPWRYSLGQLVDDEGCGVPNGAADEAYIARCVNRYDELVGALEELWLVFGNTDPNPDESIAMDRASERAEAALRNAKAGE